MLSEKQRIIDNQMISLYNLMPKNFLDPDPTPIIAQKAQRNPTAKSQKSENKNLTKWNLLVYIT